jgi:hypothetical protein
MASFHHQYEQWSIAIKKKVNRINTLTCKETKIKEVRSLYLFINNTKYQMCCFDQKSMIFWRTADIKRHEIIQQLNHDFANVSKKKIGPLCDVKRISMLITTLKKHENPCISIVILLNNVFCHDLVREIIKYI